MIILSEYKNLVSEIEILQWLHEGLRAQLQRNRRDVWGHSMPLPKALNQYDSIIERMAAVEDELERSIKLKADIEDKLQSLTGIEYAVFMRREIDGMSLQQIADELKCSYSYISKISSKLGSATSSAKSVKDTVAKS